MNVLVLLVKIYAVCMIVMSGRQRGHECTNVGKVRMT